MAEIKRMNSAVSITDTDFLSSAMERALERERVTGRRQHIAAAAGRYMGFLIALAVIAGILMQSIAIYAMQRNLQDINNQIFQMQRTNETLKVTVLKAGNLDTAKGEAAAEKYVSRAGRAGLSVDLNYNNFTGSAASNNGAALPGKISAQFK